jgi:hypothetical protein
LLTLLLSFNTNTNIALSFTNEYLPLVPLRPHQQLAEVLCLILPIGGSHVFAGSRHVEIHHAAGLDRRCLLPPDRG